MLDVVVVRRMGASIWVNSCRRGRRNAIVICIFAATRHLNDVMK
jgi:hypothetical protein